MNDLDEIQKKIDELDERHNILLQDSAKIKSQIENAKFEQKTYGIPIDSRWFTKANQALRHKNNEQQENRIRRGQLRQEKHIALKQQEHQKSESFFRSYYFASLQVLSQQQQDRIRSIAENDQIEN